MKRGIVKVPKVDNGNEQNSRTKERADESAVCAIHRHLLLDVVVLLWLKCGKAERMTGLILPGDKKEDDTGH